MSPLIVISALDKQCSSRFSHRKRFKILLNFHPTTTTILGQSNSYTVRVVWTADGTYLNMTNHCHHPHYHHNYPHDAVTAGQPQITKWLQARWLRGERQWLKRGQRRGKKKRVIKPNVKLRGHRGRKMCSDGSVSPEEGSTEEKESDQYASESHRGAEGWGREMGRETAIMSSLLLLSR